MHRPYPKSRIHGLCQGQRRSFQRFHADDFQCLAAHRVRYGSKGSSFKVRSFQYDVQCMLSLYDRMHGIALYWPGVVIKSHIRSVNNRLHERRHLFGGNNDIRIGKEQDIAACLRCAYAPSSVMAEGIVMDKYSCARACG